GTPDGTFVAAAVGQAHGVGAVRRDGVDVEIVAVVHGGVDDAVAARGPCRGTAVGVVVGDAARVGPVAVHHVEHGPSGAVGQEHEFLSVGAPAGRRFDAPREGEAHGASRAGRRTPVDLAVAVHRRGVGDFPIQAV